MIDLVVGFVLVVVVAAFIVVPIAKGKSQRFRQFTEVAGKWTRRIFLAWMLVTFCFVGYVLVCPEFFVKVGNPQWHVERNGDFVLDWIALKNEGTSIVLKDFTIGCDVRANSGTTLATLKGTVYETLNKGEVRMFSGLTMGKYPDQGASVSCRVVSAHYVW